MIGVDVVTASAVRDGSDQNCLPGTKVVAGVVLGRRAITPIVGKRDQVENGAGEAADLRAALASYIPRHRKGLEIDPRPCDGRADVEVDASRQLLDRAG